MFSTSGIAVRRIALIAGTTISAPCVSGNFILMEKTFMCEDKKPTNVHKNNNLHYHYFVPAVFTKQKNFVHGGFF